MKYISKSYSRNSYSTQANVATNPTAWQRHRHHYLPDRWHKCRSSAPVARCHSQSGSKPGRNHAHGRRRSCFLLTYWNGQPAAVGRPAFRDMQHRRQRRRPSSYKYCSQLASDRKLVADSRPYEQLEHQGKTVNLRVWRQRKWPAFAKIISLEFTSSFAGRLS